jgi:hypothetical protein
LLIAQEARNMESMNTYRQLIEQIIKAQTMEDVNKAYGAVDRAFQSENISVEDNEQLYKLIRKIFPLVERKKNENTKSDVKSPALPDTMKIRDMFTKGFNEKYGDVDIINDVTDEYSYAFCGDIELTEQGKDKYMDILDDEIQLLKMFSDYGYVACAQVDKYGTEWLRHWNRIDELFREAAGYIPQEKYDMYFEVA